MMKYLVIRFSSIGDIVLTTPVIRCLKLQQPGAEVHFITKKQFVSVVEANPYIDKIITIQKDLEEVIPLLRSENYTHIVDLHKSLRSLFLRFKLRRPGSSFPKLNIRKFLLCKLKINLLPDIHIVDRYFKAVEKLGIRNDGKGLDYFVPEKDQVPLALLPESHRKGFNALVIGGKHATKQMPQVKLAELCHLLKKPLIILGGKEDRRVGEFIENNTQLPVFNACGLFNLNQSASILSSADRVISHDTGLMHISAAFKKDILSIWGNTIPGFGMYQYFPTNYSGDSEIVEVKDLACRPCSKLGYPACPKGHFNCMNHIDLKYIADWVEKQ